MRKLAALFVLAALPTPAFAQMAMPGFAGLYIQAYGGLRVPDTLQFQGVNQDLGIGNSLGASVGVDTTIPGLSADLDYMHSSANYNALGTALNSDSFMVDGIYNIDINMPAFKPYVGGGLGLVNVNYKSADDSTAPAFQLKAGVSGPITGQLSWFGEYRYQQAFGQLSMGSPPYNVEYASHSILAGIKISFGGGAPAGGGYGGDAGY
ncbi:MAG TPA: outer membrane beta-barrel protein [Devosiaceae bacterium]|jgi:opacity protein-like surface antigen|nr:outer membrane beta-barrel protein [Devosiaceae bacterium]